MQIQIFLGLSLLTLAYARLYWVNIRSVSSSTHRLLFRGGRGVTPWDKAARYTHGGATFPGRGHEDQACWFTYEQSTYSVHDGSCEMLVLDKSDLHTSVSFVPKTFVDGIPSGAIIGGRTADKFPLYIVQMAQMGNLDARNNYAEYSIPGGSPGSSTDWDYMVIVYKARVLASRYLARNDVLDRTLDTSLLPDSSVLSDSVNDTCLPVIAETGHTLRIVFDFPSANETRKISAEIVMRNVTDCKARAWTWYTESTCTPGYYQECAKTPLWQTGDLTVCMLTCVCTNKCDYLHLKFEPKTHDTFTGAQLCEITQNGVYGSVEPSVGN